MGLHVKYIGSAIVGYLSALLLRSFEGLGITLTYQNLPFCRVPKISILGFIIRTYKKVGFGRLR